MSGITPECTICNSRYNESDRRPLILRCGHTHCEQCLRSLASIARHECPTCRTEFTSRITDLYVNYVMIPSTSTERTNTVSIDLQCTKHENELDFWCVGCRDMICKKCLTEEHAGHKFTLSEDIVQSSTKTLNTVREKVKSKLNCVRSSLGTFKNLEALTTELEKRKCVFSARKRLLQEQADLLSEGLRALSETPSEPSVKKRKTIIKTFRLLQNNQAFEKSSVSDSLPPILDWVKNYKGAEANERWMANCEEWLINSYAVAKKALVTISETHHQTPKATVMVTEANPISCLTELLSRLDKVCTRIDVQITASGQSSIFFDELRWHRFDQFKHGHFYHLLATAMFELDEVSLASAARMQVETSENVVVVVSGKPSAHAYDTYVIAMGSETIAKVLERGCLKWPLPLEIHLVGLKSGDLLKMESTFIEWHDLCCITSVVGVYLPKCQLPYDELKKLFTFLGKLRTKLGVEHAVFLPVSSWSAATRRGILTFAAALKVPVQFTNNFITRRRRDLLDLLRSP